MWDYGSVGGQCGTIGLRGNCLGLWVSVSEDFSDFFHLEMNKVMSLTVVVYSL